MHKSQGGRPPTFFKKKKKTTKEKQNKTKQMELKSFFKHKKDHRLDMANSRTKTIA